ncbi:MAG: Spy/CpxP family protein refolding chaperone [Acidobacteriota bacterium]|nr:Spy/CpxP family protein refolding chaperone [Acidobacteriota bacterium]
MKKRSIAVFVALMLSAGIGVFAAQQQGKMGKGKPTIDQQVARMKAELNLTDQQTPQVKELLEKQAQDRETWRSSNPNPTKEEMQTHRKQMYQQMNEGLKKILTPEQFKKHEEMMRQRMHHGPPQN